MQIVINKTPEPFKDGKYMKMQLSYSRDGKDDNRKLVRIGDTEKVFDVLEKSQAGEVYEIDLKKSDDGKYWNWVGGKKIEGASAGKAAVAATRSNYETPEERAQRQLYIARQSCIGYAVGLLGNKAKKEEVVEVAQFFVDFVYGAEPQTGEVVDEEGFE